MISIEKQISFFLDNRPGTLARVCQALAKENINISALAISDTVDSAIIRMIASDSSGAAKVLQRLNVSVHERDVIFMKVPNKPGMLSEIANKLAANGINIEYAYCTGSPDQADGSMVLRTSDIESTLSVLG
jgi:hypothetical protein